MNPRMRMRFFVALVTILSIIPVWSVHAQDGPCVIEDGFPGVTIDSVHVTDPAGYTASQWRGWDPAYEVTEFGPWEPIFIIMNYTIKVVPCRVKAVFRAFGEERIVVERKRVAGSYSVTEMFFPEGADARSYKIGCILRARNAVALVGKSKAVCTITIVE